MIMILDVDVTAEGGIIKLIAPLKGSLCIASIGGRRLAVRTAMVHPIGALPRTPFCHYVAFPLKGKREIWREKQGVIYFMYHSGVSPFGGWRHHLSPASGGTITGAYCRARKCTPFGGWRHHLPPGGGTLFFAMR